MAYGAGNTQVVGTCGLCRGAVVLPVVWFCVIPPIPTCEECGATVAQNGPILPMNPPVKAGTPLEVSSGMASGKIRR